MSPAAIIAELRRRDPLLTAIGSLMAAGFVAALALSFADTRTILGINPWIKPMKFFSSVAIFLWTMAWFMPEADPRHARRLTLIRWTMVVTMVGELTLICLQAGRGTTSHFNVSTLFNAIVFQVMGTMILVNSIAVAMFLVSLRSEVPGARAGYLRGLRLGLLIFVIASLEGFMMVANQAHAVPRPDGGPGLPFVNWSTTGGDLRIAHFLGLHALQLLPLAGYVFDRTWKAAPSVRARGVSIVAVVWALAVAAVLWQALAGRPLVALPPA
jgi:hypothetical protein